MNRQATFSLKRYNRNTRYTNDGAKVPIGAPAWCVYLDNIISRGKYIQKITQLGNSRGGKPLSSRASVALDFPPDALHGPPSPHQNSLQNSLSICTPPPPVRARPDIAQDSLSTCIPSPLASIRILPKFLHQVSSGPPQIPLAAIHHPPHPPGQRPSLSPAPTMCDSDQALSAVRPGPGWSSLARRAILCQPIST